MNWQILARMLFHEGELHPLETTNFMIMGYTVIFGVMAIYILSLKNRKKNLELDLEILEEEG